MTDENGNLSIDFLAGFTIFMLAFIWVVSMIPGLMIGLQSYTIDYDAVAYRTGVILVEDPGWPVSPPWESFIDQQKSNVTRFGLALSKDTPNILSEDKVNRFFCATAFVYPEDYRTRVIFGDYPYGFNISLIDDGGKIKSVGDVLPNGYGYIRRPVKIKGASNATINQSYIQSHSFTKADNATTHVFSILIDNPKLLGDITDPAYQIDPAREQITINITDLRSTITNYPPVINNTTSTITLRNVKVYKQDGGVYSNVPLPATDFPYIDGSSTRISAMPYPVTDNITLRFSPQFFDRLKAQSSKIYIALGFTVSPESTFLNNTQALPDFNTLDGQLTFNNPNTKPFYYDYNTTNVTQPHLRDAVVEVAVWSGAVTSYGGGGVTPINGTHTIYASAGIGGTISPSGSVIVNDGANQNFAINASANYHITDVVVDGVSNGIISSYTFSNVTQDHTIAASIAIDTYTITPSAGANGTINPSTPQTVPYGSTPIFTLSPDLGYFVTVTVDGTPVTPTGNSYTFPAVMANHTINASFAVSTFTITATTGANGAINPAGSVPLIFGDTPTFNFTPDIGYHVADVLVDGSSVGAMPSYTFLPVTINHTISVSYAINTYTLTPSAGAGGNISPSGVVTVNYDGNQTFAITPNAGYHIDSVLVDGVSQGSIGSYQFTNVVANHVINASFAIDTFTITPSAGAGGSITPSTPQTVNYGSSPSFTITKNNGYHIMDVLVDGSSVGAVASYTFPAVTANHTISASFAANARTQIYYEGFESGSTGWVLSGGASRQNTAGIPKNQTWVMRLRNVDNMYRPTSTSTYSSIVVEFAWALTSNAPGENAYVEYSTNGGTSWNSLSQINGPVTQNTLAIFTSAPLPSSADNNANFRLRFRITGSSTADILYVDDVKITGIPD
jgi:hypothetical protein